MVSRYNTLTILLLIFSAVWLSACSGLAGEPEIVATLPPPATPVAQLTTVLDSIPARPPDLANGARIFMENCAACHGENGEGNGEFYLTEQIPFPGNFRDPQTAQNQYPQEWYSTITNGRLDRLMPPWGATLSEQERWDVAMYTYTLHYTADQLELGRVLYQDCAECHGLTGQGDGPSAEGEVRDLTSLNAMMTLSDRAMQTMVREGSTDAMPAYDLFSDEDVAAVVAYARTLSLANVSAVFNADQPEQQQIPAPVITPEVSAPAEPSDSQQLRDITGDVINQTEGGNLPPVGDTVLLRVFSGDTFTLLEERETTLDADHRFTFEGVNVLPAAFYLTAVRYQERGFASGLADGATLLEMPELPIDIYELTDDPAAVRITGAVAQIRVIGDNIEVSQFTQYENVSDRVYTSLTPDEDGLYPSLEIGLPVAAIVLNLDDPGSYIISEDGLTVYDIRPLLPGEERLTFVTYLVQYGGGAILEYPLVYRVEGQVRVLLHPPDTLTLDGGELLPRIDGTQTLSGIEYGEYGGFAALPAGSSLRYEISGQGIPTASTIVETTGIIDAGALPLVIGGIVALILVLIASALWLSRRGGANKKAEIDRLLGQIAALDAQHNAGAINHDVYQRQRAELKAQLAKLLGTEGGAE